MRQVKWGVQWELARYITGPAKLRYEEYGWQGIKTLENCSNAKGAEEVLKLVQRRNTLGGHSSAETHKTAFDAAFARERAARVSFHFFFVNALTLIESSI